MATKTQTKTYELICQEWEESERGWGVRPDGYTLYLTKEARDNHIASWEKNRNEEIAKNPGYVPDCYDRLSGKPFRVRVPKNIYDKVKKSDGYVWGTGNSCPYERTV